MTKRKDHLLYLDDVAKSVLLGSTVNTLCGRERNYTREDIDDTEYSGTCKDCMRIAGDDAASRKDLIRILPKAGWLNLIEQAWLARYEDSITPKVSAWSNAGPYTYNYTFKSWDAPKAGDVA